MIWSVLLAVGDVRVFIVCQLAGGFLEGAVERRISYMVL